MINSCMLTLNLATLHELLINFRNVLSILWTFYMDEHTLCEKRQLYFSFLFCFVKDSFYYLLWISHTFCFFVRFLLFWLTTWYLNIIMWYLRKSDSFPPQRLCCLWCVGCTYLLFSDFRTYFCKVCIFCHCELWSLFFCSFSIYSATILTKTFLKAKRQKN